MYANENSVLVESDRNKSMFSGITVFATSSAVAGERVPDLCRCFVAPCHCSA